MGFLKHGVHKELEAAANELIRESLEGVTSMAEKSDILTPWKEQDRLRREVYNSTGVPEAHTLRGMYHRAAWSKESGGSHRNSRDGLARGSRTSSLKDFTDNNSQYYSGDGE